MSDFRKHKEESSVTDAVHSDEEFTETWLHAEGIPLKYHSCFARLLFFGCNVNF